MKKSLFAAALLATSLLAGPVYAQGDLEVNTPAIAAIKSGMQARFAQLEPWFAAGAIGLTRDGKVEIRDPAAIPLAQRQSVNSLVSAENRDRANLYQEIARANAHPEWEGEINKTFGTRWIDKARPGWWIQDASGQWKRK